MFMLQAYLCWRMRLCEYRNVRIIHTQSVVCALPQRSKFPQSILIQFGNHNLPTLITQEPTTCLWNGCAFWRAYAYHMHLKTCLYHILDLRLGIGRRIRKQQNISLLDTRLFEQHFCLGKCGIQITALYGHDVRSQAG